MTEQTKAKPSVVVKKTKCLTSPFHSIFYLLVELDFSRRRCRNGRDIDYAGSNIGLKVISRFCLFLSNVLNSQRML